MDLGLGVGLLSAFEEPERGHTELSWFTGLHVGWSLAVAENFDVTPLAGLDLLAPLFGDTRFGNARLGGSIGVRLGADLAPRPAAHGPFPIVRSRRIATSGWTIAYVRWSPDPVKRGENGLVIFWDVGW